MRKFLDIYPRARSFYFLVPNERIKEIIRVLFVQSLAVEFHCLRDATDILKIEFASVSQ